MGNWGRRKDSNQAYHKDAGRGVNSNTFHAVSRQDSKRGMKKYWKGIGREDIVTANGHTFEVNGEGVAYWGGQEAGYAQTQLAQRVKDDARRIALFRKLLEGWKDLGLAGNWQAAEQLNEFNELKKVKGEPYAMAHMLRKYSKELLQGKLA